MKSLLRIIILLLSLGFASGMHAQDNSTKPFNQGVAYFNAGNYEEALRLWTGLYNTGTRSANLCYNIGNACFKLNRIPDAILYFERASLLDPADEDINYNLQIARTMTVDRFQEIPELFFVKWYNFMALSLHTNIWARLSLVSFFLMLASVSLYVYSSKYRLKVAGFWLAAAFLVVSVFSIAMSYRNRELVYDSGKAIITSPVINGKSSPDAAGTDLFVLHEGTKVTIEDKVGEWFEIRLSDGNKGWIPVNSLAII